MSETFSLDRERFDSYKRIKNAAEHLLDSPGLQSRLGAEQIDRYRSILAGAFLPEIRGGRVILPRHQFDTDNIAIIPLVERDRETGLYLDKSMMAATPSRLEIIHDDLARRYGYNKEEVDAYLQEPKRALGEDLNGDLANMSPNFRAATSGQAVELKNGMALTPRTHMLFAPGVLNSPRRAVGVKALHETSHADDMRNLVNFPKFPEDHIASSEIKAVSVTGHCLEAAGVICDGEILDHAMLEQEGFMSCVRAVRAMRQGGASPILDMIRQPDFAAH